MSSTVRDTLQKSVARSYSLYNDEILVNYSVDPWVLMVVQAAKLCTFSLIPVSNIVIRNSRCNHHVLRNTSGLKEMIMLRHISDWEYLKLLYSP